MTVKALKKQMMAAIAMVVVSAIALSSSTYAWFASNNRVSATNMQVIATASQSLVITNDALPSASTGTITVASSDVSATALIPTTHDSTWATYENGLKYNTNPGNVSASTGLVEDGKDPLTFGSAVNSVGSTYYKDYIVYIAANGGALAGQDIQITLQNPVVDTLPGATSIDFYYASVSATGTITPSDTTFVGTLNLAQLDSETNDASTSKTMVTISPDGGVNIPKANSDAAIEVLMRVYVDGALKDYVGAPADTTFVKNVDVAEVAGQRLAVDFTAVAHE